MALQGDISRPAVPILLQLNAGSASEARVALDRALDALGSSAFVEAETARQKLEAQKRAAERAPASAPRSRRGR